MRLALKYSISGSLLISNRFNRLGIKIIPTVSDNGVIGGKVAEEFQAITDLGEDKTGYDFAKWLIEHQVIGYFSVHSLNFVGRANIVQLLTHYGWKQIYKNHLIF